MTRSGAREIALHVVLNMDFTGDSAEDVLTARFDSEYYGNLAEEVEAYSDKPSKKQESYIRTVVKKIEAEKELIAQHIEKYSIGWKISRISRITKAILELAVCEILFVDDVPTSVAINEAVNLSKKYDSKESSVFVNGVLGAFVRGEGIE